MRLSPAFAIFAAVWIIAMTSRIYPQFGDALRLNGRLETLGGYIEESCAQRIGPAAATCLDEARATGQRLVAREQGKSILLIEAPLIFWLALYLPLRLVGGRAAGAAGPRRHHASTPRLEQP